MSFFFNQCELLVIDVSHYAPSGLTPLTFRSQPHLSSSPLLQPRVTATATAADERAWTKAASRVPEDSTQMEQD